MSDYQHIRYAAEDGILTITLHRPDQLNAFTSLMAQELIDAFDRSDRDDAIKCVIVTGEGRAFCAGADLGRGGATWGDHERRMAADEAGSPYKGDGGGRVTRRIFDSHKPVIAAINGPAAGVGLVLACYCDIRFAAEGAKLTTSSGRLGLPAEYGLSWVLPRLVGVGHAADLLLSSRVVLAEEAERIGLVNRVCPADELVPATLEYATAIAHGISPSSLRESKRQLYTDLHRDVGRAVEESEMLLERMATEADFREGVAAWQERRPPKFT
jgi:enoyl-CoA hydratase/carnithine racemase